MKIWGNLTRNSYLGNWNYLCLYISLRWSLFYGSFFLNQLKCCRFSKQTSHYFLEFLKIGAIIHKQRCVGLDKNLKLSLTFLLFCFYWAAINPRPQTDFWDRLRVFNDFLQVFRQNFLTNFKILETS